MYTDIPYIVFYLSLFVCTILYWKYESPLAVKASFVITFIFFAFRAPVVGADTWNYVRYLAGMRDYYSEWDDRALEPLFVLYRTMTSSVTSSFAVVMILNTIISMGPLLYIIKKYSYNAPLALLMFFNLNGIALYFVGLRQIFALVPLLIVLLYCYEKKLPYLKTIVFFFIASIIAFGLHSTGVIYGMIYCIALLVTIKERKWYIILIVGSAVLGLLNEKLDILEYLSKISAMNLTLLQRVDAYLVEDEVKEFGAITLALRPSALGLIVFSFVKEKYLNHPFSKIFLAGIIMYNFFAVIPMVHRIVIPLIMFGSVTFTWCFDFDKEIEIRKKNILYIITILMMAYFCRSWYIKNTEWTIFDEDCMHPYYFIYEDYV